jgi:hypothetical protein
MRRFRRRPGRGRGRGSGGGAPRRGRSPPIPPPAPRPAVPRCRSRSRRRGSPPGAWHRGCAGSSSSQLRRTSWSPPAAGETEDADARGHGAPHTTSGRLITSQ